MPEGEYLLTPVEVAGLLGVSAETIRDWAERGKLTVVRTPGGQARYRHTEVMMHVAAMAPRPQAGQHPSLGAGPG